jgi:hypothetical protein
MQDMIQQYRAIISSNRRSRVIVTSVFDHLDIPPYPKTSANRIIHFVSLQGLLLNDNASLLEARAFIAKHMSKVCYAYISSMFDQLTQIGSILHCRW